MDESNIYFFDPVELDMPPLPADGYMLDIGGGGEGVIGRLAGARVVAIDLRKDELAEAPEGPLKVVMDARELKFLDETFVAVTAFFAFMYFDDEPDLQAALAEALRVLKPGGRLHVWDVDMAASPKTRKPLFAVRLKYLAEGRWCEAAYGRPWPAQTRDSQSCRRLAEAAGFSHVNTEIAAHTFYATFRKP